MPALLRTIIIALTLSAAFTSPVAAQVAPVELERQVVRLFGEKQYAKALELIEGHLANAPGDVIMLYNAACACAQLGRIDDAITYLERSVKAGFVQFDHMETDPDLAPVRDHPRYINLLSMRDEINRRYAERQIEVAREFFGEEGYRYETDDLRRLNFATALDDTSHAEMRAMIEQQADHLADTLFDAPPEYFVIIAVPTPADSIRLLGNENVGGIYEHPRRRLISKDIGYLLRHEFTHVMHWGHMERLNQKHPLWIQEGLATLYEDYRFRSDGSVDFLPNNRHNIAKRLARIGRHMHFRDILTVDEQRFMREATQLYPQVRSMFMFLAAEGKLLPWYRALVEHFDEDPTGRKAFESVFNKPLDDVERDWRTWLIQQPDFDDRVEAGDASLGIEIDSTGANDGVVVRRILPGSAARGQLRPRDVIVAIDSRAVRSFDELVAALADRRVGETVTVRLRRGGRYLDVPVTLSRLGG